VGALPPHPRSLPLKGNLEGQEKERQSTQPCPSVIPRRGARVALQQSLILRADEPTIPGSNKESILKKLDTRKKLRHKRKHLTHHHYWKKRHLLRITALYPQLAKKKFVVDMRS